MRFAAARRFHANAPIFQDRLHTSTCTGSRGRGAGTRWPHHLVRTFSAAEVAYKFLTMFLFGIDMKSISTEDDDSATFVLACFALLGIERLLYGYCYHFTDHFKRSVRKGSFGSKIQAEPLYWRAMMELGKMVKVFQFSVIFYDFLGRKNVSEDLLNPIGWSMRRAAMFFVGLSLFLLGQSLNIAVFRALTPLGVYYGYEFGYPVARVTCFPYNTRFISDPQYWGVVICIWGAYIGLGSTSFIIPILETLWYVMSMQLLEHSRGKAIVRELRSIYNNSNFGDLLVNEEDGAAKTNPQSPYNEKVEKQS